MGFRKNYDMESGTVMLLSVVISIRIALLGLPLKMAEIQISSHINRGVTR